jgi:hypothetical protein
LDLGDSSSGASGRLALAMSAWIAAVAVGDRFLAARPLDLSKQLSPRWSMLLRLD